MHTNLKREAPEKLREKTQRLGLIKEIFIALDLTDTQLEQARGSYTAVGEWIAASEDPLLTGATISVQGSVALGTATRPIMGNEFDVDLLSLFLKATWETSPEVVKRALGQRLRYHGTYGPMLIEKMRCWRLNYAGHFHLDITPAIINPTCSMGGILVPDKKLKQWKPTNPKGYQEKFQQYAGLVPDFPLLKSFTEARSDSKLEPFPGHDGKPRLLPLIVKMAKRHRDIFFLYRDRLLAPISVIITTLGAWSYAACARAGSYESELDFVIEVVRRMPEFIRIEDRGGRKYFIVPNETTEGENFAEKWNDDPRLAEAFYEWHRALRETLGGYENAQGIDAVGKTLSVAFGESVVKDVVTRWTANVSQGRVNKTLNVVPAIGLTTAHVGVPVKQNHFFGKK